MELFKCWHYLSFRAVTRQVLSALVSLTSVFGMGTGGPSQQSIPTHMDGSSPSFIVKSLPASNRFILAHPVLPVNCFLRTAGDPYRIRTDVKGVRGLCLNHLTNGPFGTPSVGDRKNCRWQVFHCRVPDQSVAPLGSKRLEVLPRVYLYQKRKLSHTVSVWYTFRDSNPGHPD